MSNGTPSYPWQPQRQYTKPQRTGAEIRRPASLNRRLCIQGRPGNVNSGQFHVNWFRPVSGQGCTSLLPGARISCLLLDVEHTGDKSLVIQVLNNFTDSSGVPC